MFGTVLEMKQTSAKGRLEMKKYTGVWRWESVPTAKMISRFPSTVITYMTRNSPKMMGYRSGFSESPKRRNIVVSERFAGLMLITLTEKIKVIRNNSRKTFLILSML
jgi:hypothetical protein